MEHQPYSLDLHGHTNKSLPELLTYNYIEAINRAKLVGLDGIALTEHNTLKGLQKAIEEGDRKEMIVVPGVEISNISVSPGWIIPTSHHLLALGIDPYKTHGVPMMHSSKDIIHWIHDQGGVAIGVHAKPKPTFMSMSYDQLEELASLLDGMEVINGGDFLKNGLMGNTRMKKMAAERGLAQIGGSDFHSLDAVGVVATKVFRNCERWQDVIEAIRQRQVEPFIRSIVPFEARQRVRFSNLLISGF